MDIGRDVRRLIGREPKSTIWTDATALELLPLAALKGQTAAAGLAAHQAERRERDQALLVYASMLREIARRTGQDEPLVRAATAAARASAAGRGDIAAAARLEQAACARLRAELFADITAGQSAHVFLAEAGSAALRPELELRRVGLAAALAGAVALAEADLDQAVEAAGALDAAVERLDAEVRTTGKGQTEAAGLACDRADVLIGFGVRLKDRTLLERAERDLADLTGRIDPDYLPLSWARAEGLRGAAMAALGELDGDAKRLTESVTVLAAAAEHADFAYSPFDQARISHSLALALASLAEASDDEGLFDHALAAHDQALALLPEGEGLSLRAVAAHDRAGCVARRAERNADGAALSRAESLFRADLAARNAAADPAAWAVTQLALARIYVAQAGLVGGAPPPEGASVALTEALDVFIERGLKTLAETAQTALEQLREIEGR